MSRLFEREIYDVILFDRARTVSEYRMGTSYKPPRELVGSFMRYCPEINFPSKLWKQAAS